MQCHVCAGWFGQLGHHVVRTHGLPAQDYKAYFGLRASTGYGVAADLARVSRQPRHNRLHSRLVRLLGPGADAATYEVFGSAMRRGLCLSGRGRATPRYSYPDVIMLCDHELRESKGHDELHVTPPCVIVDILGRRTARIDQKLEIYQGFPSVQACPGLQ